MLHENLNVSLDKQIPTPKLKQDSFHNSFSNDKQSRLNTQAAV